MNILIANDDGIFRRGIEVLGTSLSAMPDVNIYVFAPDSEKTAASMWLTTREALKLTPYDPKPFGAKEAWAVSGTPADCVRVGLDDLKKRGIGIDLVCTGINHGFNIGGDTFFSGTVGAAAQAVLKQVPAIAFSLGDHNCTHFEHFEWLVPHTVKKCMGKIPPMTVINVNAPDLPKSGIKGVKVCPVGRHYLEDSYEILPDGTRKITFSEQEPPRDADPDQDGLLAMDGWITVSPVVLKRSPAEAVEYCKSLGFSMPER